MGISISFELPVLRLIGGETVIFNTDLMHDFKYWVLAWLTPKSSFGWPVADTKGTPSWTMVELFAHYTGGHHLSLYFDYTNTHYIEIHVTIHIISYIAFEIYITQADANFNDFTIATTILAVVPLISIVLKKCKCILSMWMGICTTWNEGTK